MACLEDPAPLLDCKQKCLCSVCGEIVCPCPPVNRRDEHTLSKDWPFLWRCFARLKTLSLYFPIASPSLFCLLTLVPHCFWSIKETDIQTPVRCLFWGTSLLPSQSAGSLIKSLPCLNPLSLRFIGLWCGKQTELGLSNTGHQSAHFCGQHDTRCPVCSAVSVLHVVFCTLFHLGHFPQSRWITFLFFLLLIFPFFKKFTTRYSIGRICPELFNLCIDSHLGGFKHFAV